MSSSGFCARIFKALEVNKSLEWSLPTDGPKTLSGLILEHLESFPDANAGLAINDYRLEILELEGNVVQAVRAQLAAEQTRDSAHSNA